VGRKHLIPPVHLLYQRVLVKLLLLVLDQQAVLAMPEVPVLAAAVAEVVLVAAYFLATAI
jgi:hypothetical protein